MVKWKNKKTQIKPIAFISLSPCPQNFRSIQSSFYKFHQNQNPVRSGGTDNGVGLCKHPVSTRNPQEWDPPPVPSCWRSWGSDLACTRELSRDPLKIPFLPPWCPMATTQRGETQLLPFPSPWHYMAQNTFSPEILGNSGFYSEWVYPHCNDHNHSTRGWYLF